MAFHNAVEATVACWLQARQGLHATLLVYIPTVPLSICDRCASLQMGPSSDVRQRALLDLADQLIYEPCYDTLRTKEQLGYTVSSGSRLTHGVLGFCVVVVSAKYSAEVGMHEWGSVRQAAAHTAWSCDGCMF
jgi:hypothetical protein